MNTNNFNTNAYLVVVLGLLFISITSCKNDGTSTAAQEVEETAQLVEDNAEEAVKDLKSAGKELINDAKENMRVVYNLTEVDTPPLFDKACGDKKEPRKCSDDKLLDFIKDNAKFPKRAKNNATSLEQVVVVIEKDGSISSTKYVASGNKETCEGCQQAAADVVGMMKSWIPATKNGSPVAVSYTIPIKFGR